MSINAQQDAEVEWYRQHGHYTDRIAITRGGERTPYVIGDEAWNRRNPGRQEHIEHLLPRLPSPQRNQK